MRRKVFHGSQPVRAEPRSMSGVSTMRTPSDSSWWNWRATWAQC
jgi:hypothetical protein